VVDGAVVDEVEAEGCEEAVGRAGEKRTRLAGDDGLANA
jgi:hypothetical protein